MPITRGGFVYVTGKLYYAHLKKLILGEKNHLARPMLNLYLKEFGMFDSKMVSIVSLYLCKKDLSKALAFRSAMGLEGLSCNASTEIVKSLVKRGRVHDATNFIAKVTEKGSDLDVFAYTIVVDGLCKEGYLEKALDLCAFMKHHGIHPNVFTYNAVISGLCKQGCIDEAFRLFNSMEKVNIMPTVTTYGILISCMCREGLLDDSAKIFERMLCNGVTPNTHIYNSLIYGHSTLGLTDKCLKFLYEMEMKCLQPDCFTVSAVIHGFCMKGDMVGALQFYYRYRKNAYHPDFFGFFSLIKGLYFKGRMEETRSIIREMLQCQLVAHFINQYANNLDVESVTSSLFVLCEQGRIKDAIGLLSEIGYVSFPSARSNGFTKNARINRMQNSESLTTSNGKLLSTIYHSVRQQQEETDNSSCFSPALQDYTGLSNETKMTRDNKLIENYVSNQTPTDFHSYYSTISLLCSKGEFCQANKLVKTMILNLK